MIRKLIMAQAPDQLKLDNALWTRKAVRELIEQKTGLDMPIRTVGEYLKRWAFTPQMSAKQAYEQCPKAGQRWPDDDYPQIKARSRTENVEIYWGDETGLSDLVSTSGAMLRKARHS